MTKNPPRRSPRNGTRRLPQMIRETSRLERLSWTNWVLVVSITVAVTLGLAGALYGASRDEGSVWPWGKTESTMLVGLALSVLFLCLHLTRQQVRLSSLRRELLVVQKANSERVSRHFDRLVAILNVSRTMGTETDLQTVLDTITKTCGDTFPSDRVSLMLVNRENSELEVRSSAGAARLAEVSAASVKIGEGVAGWVAETLEPVVLGESVDPGRFRTFAKKHDAPTAAMVVPIVLRRELIGVLNVTSHDPRVQYNEEDLQALLVFAESAGICCRHAEQAAWMRDTIRRLDGELTANRSEAHRPAA